MAKNLIIILMVVTISLGLALVAGCESDAQTVALIGTAIGAAAGQAIGGDTESTLIGAGVGAVCGYIIGNESDKKNRFRQALVSAARLCKALRRSRKPEAAAGQSSREPYHSVVSLDGRVLQILFIIRCACSVS